MLELIKKAEEKGLDVIITDGCFYLERTFNKKEWREPNELGWFFTDEEVCAFEILGTEETEDKFFYITVDEI